MLSTVIFFCLLSRQSSSIRLRIRKILQPHIHIMEITLLINEAGPSPVQYIMSISMTMRWLSRQLKLGHKGHSSRGARGLSPSSLPSTYGIISHLNN